MSTHHEFIRKWVYLGPTPYFGHVKKTPPKKKPGRSGPYGTRRKTEKCKRYKVEGRREKNKERKLRKHCKRHPNDLLSFRSCE
jgi:hypothetical protein